MIVVFLSFFAKKCKKRCKYVVLTSDFSDFVVTSVGTYPVYVRSAYQQSSEFIYGL